MAKFELYIADSENTGLDPVKNDVIEISVLRFRTGEQKTWFLKPLHPENAAPEALKVNGAKLEDLMWKTEVGKQKYRDPNDVLPEIENWLMDDGKSPYDRLLVGHNINFDINMFKSLWDKFDASPSYPFSQYGMMIDTKMLTLFFDFISDQHNGKYNLGACIKKFGIANKYNYHGAEQDVQATSELFKKLIENFKK